MEYVIAYTIGVLIAAYIMGRTKFDVALLPLSLVWPGMLLGLIIWFPYKLGKKKGGEE